MHLAMVESAASSVQGAFQSVQGDDASAKADSAASSVRGAGAAQSVQGDDASAKVESTAGSVRGEGAAQSVKGDAYVKGASKQWLNKVGGASGSAARSVKESMSSGLPAPSPTEHGGLGVGWVGDCSQKGSTSCDLQLLPVLAGELRQMEVVR